MCVKLPGQTDDNFDFKTSQQPVTFLSQEDDELKEYDIFCKT